MQEKSSWAEPLREGLVVILSALGLVMDPPVFVACILLSMSGAVIGRGFSPAMARRRAFGLSLGGGVLVTLFGFMLDQMGRATFDWWPTIPPGAIAIAAGLSGPFLLAWLMKNFPNIFERLAGKYLPDLPEDKT